MGCLRITATSWVQNGKNMGFVTTFKTVSTRREWPPFVKHACSLPDDAMNHFIEATRFCASSPIRNGCNCDFRELQGDLKVLS
jgi:hypothetical protein